MNLWNFWLKSNGINWPVTQIKRHDRFLDFADELKKRGTNLEFFIAGGDELLDQCRERIAHKNLLVKF